MILYKAIVFLPLIGALIAGFTYRALFDGRGATAAQG